MKNFNSPLSNDQIARNFSEISPDFTPSQAAIEASRCLFCYDAPCIRACPTKINVPQFIQQIADGNRTGAARTIFTENILGATCGKVCPTSELCEGACVLNSLNKKPIEIGRLQRHASEFAIKSNLQFFQAGKATNKKVAIVGAGPAGVSCAFELTKLGHFCTVYEAKDRPGGLNTYGIAGYKLKTEDALKEVDYVKRIGIEIQLNSPIGDELSFAKLLKEYDAVFLGVGLGGTAKLKIPGEELEGCLEALDFIRPTRDKNYSGCKIGKNVVVIGAGNTAIDAATAAVRLGAESVSILYRRTVAEMPAFPYEYEIAKADGVYFRWLTAPQKIVGENGRVTGIECSSMKLTSAGGIERVPNSNHLIPCDMVIKALGQEPLADLLGKISGLELKDGKVVVDPKTHSTSLKKLFAGGDAINGGGEVVDAVQHGKVAAQGINQFLMGKH